MSEAGESGMRHRGSDAERSLSLGASSADLGTTLRKQQSMVAVVSNWESAEARMQEELADRYATNEEPTQARESGFETRLRGVKNSKEEVKNAMKRLTKATKFETIDYNEVGSDIRKAWNYERPPQDYRNAELWKWIIPAMCAVVLAFLSWVVSLSIHKLTELKFDSTEYFFEKESYFSAYLTYVCFCCGYAFPAGFLVSMISPLAAGSGIPELKVFLNGVRLPGLLGLKTFAAKMVGIVFTISSGIIAGKEGPFVHGGGIVGGGLGAMGSDWISRVTHGRINVRLPRWFGGYHRNNTDHRDFTAIGTAIGVAVAFSAPIGGILFTVEEGASFYTRSAFWRAFLSTVVAVLVLETFHLLTDEKPESSFLGIFGEKLGNMHDFSLLADNVILPSSRFFYRLWELPVFMLMGCAGGVMGGTFVATNIKITTLRHKYVPVTIPHRRLLEVIFMAFVTGTLWFTVNCNSPCVDIPTDMYGYFNESSLDAMPDHLAALIDPDVAYIKFEGEILSAVPVRTMYPRLNCEPHQYSKYGQLFFTDLATALKRMIGLGKPFPAGLNPGNIPVDVVTTFFVLMFIMMTWTYGIGCASGLFVPSLALGASMGLLFAWLVQTLVGDSVVIAFPTYAVIGAGASLGGATRMTVSITILITETTGAGQLVIPLMITIFLSKLVGDFFNESIYDVHIHLRGAPILEEAHLLPHQKMITDKLQASDMMACQIVALPLRPTVADVIKVLVTYNHSTYAVTTEPELADRGEPFKLAGVIRKSQMVRLLKHRLGVIRKDKMAEYDERYFGNLSPRNDPASGSCSVRTPTTGGQSPRIAKMEQAMGTHLAPAVCVATEAGLTYQEIMQKLEEYPIKISKKEMEAIFATYGDDEKENCILNLEPFMDRDPPVVCRTETLSRTYHQLRTMGYHHMFVMDTRPTVVGMITRKDLLEDTTKLKLAEKANRFKMDLDDANFALTDLPFLPIEGMAKPSSFSYGKDGLVGGVVIDGSVEMQEVHSEGEDFDDPAERGDRLLNP
eukprot:CAMPEP_0174301656 /NCGR_PEP_ID=MMETSP0809-20121228/59169_1 /TAXON_ID=73025 ORGANISM="Eutreptiella gymnastica-like, Strain CCMP1594" /NCGR_SAMPLE_ID=MMETSP0809 /ASSEMBLY_ACC=CAM_ASM_000658 /LENGTH=1016 /DNA_ID=CAMNT_0015407439 /DNA_START=40 /DNA_END=3090 /DNA_ORIENTATION=+